MITWMLQKRSDQRHPFHPLQDLQDHFQGSYEIVFPISCIELYKTENFMLKKFT